MTIRMFCFSLCELDGHAHPLRANIASPTRKFNKDRHLSATCKTGRWSSAWQVRWRWWVRRATSAPTTGRQLWNGNSVGICSWKTRRRTVRDSSQRNGYHYQHQKSNGVGSIGIELVVHHQLHSILVYRFDRIPGELIWINRSFAIYDLPSGERRSRSQFPIELAFAATIHKCQGLTLNNIVLSTRCLMYQLACQPYYFRDIFAESQFYVGCSRIRHMSGLHLVDAHYDKVIVNKKAECEYNRLRGLHIGTSQSDDAVKYVAWNEGHLGKGDCWQMYTYDSAHGIRPGIQWTSKHSRCW